MEIELSIEIPSLEVVAGYDGPFGGKPEPALCVGAYAVGRGRAILLDRALARFRPQRPYPSKVEPLAAAKLGARLVSQADDLRFVVLVCALEEDFGNDVRHVYGALEHPDDLAVFVSAHREVSPVALAEVASAAYALDQATSVDVLESGVAMSSRCTDDTWVGANLLQLSSRAVSSSSLYRLPFRTADRKNDWTAFARITH